jgi:hypothetical protein
LTILVLILIDFQNRCGGKGMPPPAGLPDFSWNNIPKRGKYPQNIPNGHKIYNMAVK